MSHEASPPTDGAAAGAVAPSSPVGRRPGARSVKIGAIPTSPSAQESPRRVVIQRPPLNPDSPTRTVDRDYSVLRGEEAAAAQRGRSARAAVLAALTTVAVVAVVVLAVIYAISRSDDTSTAAPGQTPGPGSEGSAQPGTQPTAGGGLPPPVSGAPEPGASTAPPGLVASAEVLSGDLVEVSEVVSWPDGGPVDVPLALLDLSAGSEVEAAFDPVVTGLQVTLDGNPVVALPSGASTTQWTVQSLSGAAPTTMTVRYVLEGALVRSVPSQTGRALAVIAPLSQGAIGSLPVRIEIGYEGVLNVGCPRAPAATSQTCGRRLEDRWTAEPPVGLPAVVVVQLDLPPPLS